MNKSKKIFFHFLLFLFSFNCAYSKSFDIKGKINLPKQLLMLQKLTPKGFAMIDSVRANSDGSFSFKNTLKEETFCFLQFGTQAGLYIFLGNDEEMIIDINATQKGIDYDISGKNVKNSLDLKNFVALHYSYMAQYQQVQQYLQQFAKEKNMAQFVKMKQQEVLLKKNYEENIQKVLKSTPSSLAPYSLYLLNQHNQLSVDVLDSSLTKMIRYNTKHIYTRMLAHYVSKEKITAIGKPAPIIELGDTNGKMTSLKSLRGKVVLVDFWATWCRPCIKEVPKVRELYEKYHSSGFEIYGVSLDSDKRRWKAGIKALKMNWVHVSDLRGWQSQGAKMYDVHSIPAMFLLDKEGNISHKKINAELLEEILKQMYPKVK